jgi:hypothetical protein
VIDAKGAKVAPGDKVVLDVKVALPKGFKVNPEAPMPYLVEAPDQSGVLSGEVSPTGAKVSPPAASFQVAVPLAKAARAGDRVTLRLSLSTFQCKEGSEGFCKSQNFVWNVPVTFAAGGETQVALTTADGSQSGNRPKRS